LPDAAQQVRSALKNLPSVDDLLTALPPEHYRLTRRQIKTAIRGVLDEVRQEILQGTAPGDIAKVVKATVARRVARLASPNLMPVINGTGVVLHTGLGRAPLGGEVLDRAIRSVRGYASLELDLPSGKRGERLAVVADALQALTGAENVVVVNNNAAAVLLMLNTAAEGREVIVSRGQQVEIGGSFRIPDVIRKAYAHMVEVGATNRTHLADYENAVTPDTAALLYVHPSNYRVTGFTKEVPVSDLAGLAKKKKLPLLVDLGSGSILDQPVAGLTEEPSAAAIVKAGADVVSFSGDKLLGGPQAGILVGKAKWLKRIHKNPLYRALRCDKVILALLEQTLRTYVDTRTVPPDNLSLWLLNRSREDLKAQGEAILKRLSGKAKESAALKLVESEVEAGSGSLPQVFLPSMALAIKKPDLSAGELARNFRQGGEPVVGYINRGQYYIDLKAIPPSENDRLVAALEEALASSRSS